MISAVLGVYVGVALPLSGEKVPVPVVVQVMLLWLVAENPVKAAPVLQIVWALPDVAVGGAFIVIAGDVYTVFPGPHDPLLFPNQQSNSLTTSKVRLLVPEAGAVTFSEYVCVAPGRRPPALTRTR